MASYLCERRGRYTVRVAVPKDLRAQMGRSHIERALKTSSEVDARRRSHAQVAEIFAMFDRARLGRLDEDEVQRLALGEAHRWQEFVTRNWLDDHAQSAVFLQSDLTSDGWLTNPTTGEREPTEMRERAAELVASLGYDATEDAVTAAFKAMTRASLAVLGGRTPPPALPAPLRHSVAGKGPTLRDVYAAWARERRPPEKTLHEWERAVRRFEELHGKGVPIGEITKADIAAYKDALLQCPTRPPHKLRKLPLPRLIKMAPPDAPRASAAAVNKTLGAVRSLLSYAVDNGKLEVNVASGVSALAPEKREDEERRPFEVSELQKVLDAACNQKRVADRWLPWLGAFMGAREAEMGLARAGDVAVIEGVDVLRITDAGQGRRVKTRKSRRVVPIHRALVELGFLKYVETLDPAGPLFPELKVAAYSKRFARLLDNLGLTDPTLVFHSFRHGYKDACRAAGIVEEVHDALTGHAGGGTGRTYGNGVPVSVLADAVAKIGYPGLTSPATPLHP